MYLTGLMLGCDVRDVDQGILEAVTIKHLPAGAAHYRAGLLRWQLFASRPHCIFARGPVALIAPCLKIGLGPLPQEHCPCALEIGAGMVERCRGTVCAFSRMTARIESATPFPWVGVKQVADAPCNRPGVNIAVIDVPAIWPFRIPATGEGGECHALSKRDQRTGGSTRMRIEARHVQQPRQMFFIAASVRAFSALSGSAYFSCCDAGVLDVAALSGAVGGDILS
jgi:hypothetical protein